jgi:hypothetical protein
MQINVVNASTTREIDAASRHLGGSGPTRFSLAGIRFCLADVNNSYHWRQVTLFPRSIRNVNTSMLVV